MAEFPVHPDEVTCAWLGDVLGRAVNSVRWEPIGTGQVGDSVRFHIEYTGHGGPPTVAGKFPAADPVSRSTAAMFGLYAKEVAFYREIAPQLAVRVPQVLFAAASNDGAEFVLLFEDLGPARQGDQVAGCTLADARAAIVQAAAIHAPSWGNRTVLEGDWLRPSPAVRAQVRALYPQAQATFLERYAGMLEPELMAVCEAVAASDAVFARDLDLVCLIHGDFRLDNMLFDVRGGLEPVAVLDWQTVALGNGLTDVGYFLGCGIGDRLRRAHERELLELYCVEMTGRGVPLTVDGVWRDYVIGALHGVTTAVFSAAFVERTPRGDANFLSMARGASALVLEHRSLELLEN
jgi:hypothetical protein